jgi:predicted SAM-dependent methyltransferase
VKVNFACGRQTWKGFYCIDAVVHPKATREPDLLHAFSFDQGRLLNPLPLEDDCADEVHAYHFIEHVYAWEAESVLREFRRILKPQALMVLELPNLKEACRNLLKGDKDQMSMWPLYGDPKTKDVYMCHRWGYTPETITELVRRCGFRSVQVLAPQTHGARKNRDMRVEAR